MIKKCKRVVLFVMIFQFVFSTMIVADTSYQSYNFDYWGDVIPSPISYEPIRSIKGSEFGIGEFKDPNDMFIAEDGKIYILDSGNSRIVIFDENFNLLKVLDGFENEGSRDTFLKPGGLTVTKNGDIFVADTENNRVVMLNQEGDLLGILKDPQSDLFSEDFVFSPLKVAVDQAGRIYVVARSVFEGIMSFEADGTFISYFGTIKVRYNVADLLWRKLATKEQRKKMILFIPTEYTNIDIDSEGFVYATNIDFKSDQTINRLNPSGKDVLKKYAYSGGAVERAIVGDLDYKAFGTLSGPSAFVDIKAQDHGLYTALDLTRGRFYTYDSEGNLLYINGGLGSQLGLFKTPVAIESHKDFFYVLDRGRNEITEFKATTYGALINKAVQLRYDGNEAEAVSYWKEVLKYDANYQLAYSGIGKALLATNQNKEAMSYLKKGMDKKYYSVAFRRYRNEILQENIELILTLGGVLVLGLFGYKGVSKTERRRKRTNV